MRRGFRVRTERGVSGRVLRGTGSEGLGGQRELLQLTDVTDRESFYTDSGLDVMDTSTRVDLYLRNDCINSNLKTLL